MVSSIASRSREAEDPTDRTAGWMLGTLLAYFAAHAVLRVLAFPHGVEKDEAEQLLWTQSLALGYGAQPPLYTWLQWLVFRVTGVSVLGLALLKNLLLFGTYAFTWLAARRVVGPRLAAAATLGLLLLPQIAWESQRDLTHSVLATCAAAALLWLVVRLVERPHVGLYLALGVAAGAGLLAKYSVALYLAVWCLALATHPRTRPVLLDARVLLALAVAAAIVAPHAAWVAGHLDAVTGGTLEKISPAGAPADAGAVGGLLSLAHALAGFLGLWALVTVTLFARGLRLAAPAQPWAGLFARYLGWLALAFVAMTLAGATQFKDRWMQPVLFMAPLVFFAAFPQLERHPRVATLRRIALLLALIILVAMPLRARLDALRGRVNEMNLPVQALADAIGPVDRYVAAPSHLAGALRLQRPEVPALTVPQWQPALRHAGTTAFVARAEDVAMLHQRLQAIDPSLASLRFGPITLPLLHARRAQSAVFLVATLPAGVR